jgi:acyl dehydratase
MTFTAKRLTSKGDRGVVTSQHELINQDGEAVVVVEVVSLHLCRPPQS